MWYSCWPWCPSLLRTRRFRPVGLRFSTAMQEHTTESQRTGMDIIAPSLHSSALTTSPPCSREETGCAPEGSGRLPDMCLELAGEEKDIVIAQGAGHLLDAEITLQEKVTSALDTARDEVLLWCA